jgi:hypothetical protein
VEKAVEGAGAGEEREAATKAEAVEREEAVAVAVETVAGEAVAAWPCSRGGRCRRGAAG